MSRAASRRRQGRVDRDRCGGSAEPGAGPGAMRRAGEAAPGHVAAGTLFVVATPIGNLDDLSARTRLWPPPTTSWPRTRAGPGSCSPTSGSPRGRSRSTPTTRLPAPRWLAAGDHVALVSDAGTPLLSDPGERLARAAIDDGHDIVPIPGPSAILAGLVASGLPPVPFTFVGFPPRKGEKRARALERIISAAETTVLFESARRLAGLLGELAARTGTGEPARRIAVCRELTKVHEEVFRGTLAEGARHFGERPPRGEVTVVVEGCSGDGREATAAEVEALAGDALDAGLSPTAAAREVAARSGVPRGAAYAAVMRAKEGRGE